jgi:hypothetical protein
LQSQKVSSVENPYLDYDLNKLFERYGTEVRYENIKASYNVTRDKDDDFSHVGEVAKGAILEDVSVIAVENTAASTMHAIKKRCDFEGLPFSEEEFKKGHSLLMAKIPVCEPILLDHSDFEEWLNKCTPDKSKRMVEEWKTGFIYSDAERKLLFAKNELLLKDPGSAPRVIYQGTDMYNLMMGAMTNKISERMKHVFSYENQLNGGNRVIYAVGVSSEKIAEIICNAPGEPVESDMKSNDATQNGTMRKYEAMCYKKLGAPDWFVREFAKATSANVWTKYGLKARIENAQRFTGETTTATGNSYVRICSTLQALEMSEISDSTHVIGGDDEASIVPAEKQETFMTQLEKAATDIGMKAEVVIPPSRMHMTFYRKRNVISRETSHPIPLFGRVLAKINLRSNKNQQVDDRQYMAGKYACAAYEARHVPVIRDLLYDYSLHMSDKPYFDERSVKLAEFKDISGIRQIIEDTVPVSVDDMAEYCDLLYGVSFDDIITTYNAMANSCLQFLDGWTVVNSKNMKTITRSGFHPPRLKHPVISALIKTDCG